MRRAVLAWLAVTVLAALPARAETVEDLARVLQIDDVVAVLVEEGAEYGRALDDGMLGGTGGAFWQREVAAIHAPDGIRDQLIRAMADGMTAQDIDASIAFFDTPEGQEILAFETAARRAMADPQIEDIARAAYDQLRGSGDARLDAVARFIAVNDLIERNVAGTLSSSFHFMRGLADGGGLDLDEGAILADVWSDEDETRADTTEWMYGFLLMAYRPVDLDDLDAYVAFSAGPAGQALNAALFDGFDVIYRDISYALGLAVARAMRSSSL